MENVVSGAEEKCCNSNWKEPKFVLRVLGIVLFAGIIIIALVRERIVNPLQNQVTVYGQGKVEYQPDEATVTLGVQVDKVWSAEGALRQLNDKIARIMEAEKALGISETDIKTGSYNLSPQYDYNDGVSSVAGYNANQNLIIKVKNIIEDKDKTSRVIAAASGAGANQVLGVEFKPSDLDSLKQEARIKAITDAKSKAPALFKASEVKAGKILGWYENNVQIPGDNGQRDYAMGIGGAEGAAKFSSSPQLPAGTQEIIIEIGLNYEVK
ncbi:SIMPL domain-containing protein [Patescibacteria group bacterium]|nr:SIMPL domain-containing protein [Patescibacteria group bacterium]